MKNISIEYCHIYTNKQIGEEQMLSISILNDFGKELDSQNSSFTVMIDDYSFPDPTFDYDGFIAWLGAEGFKPDVVIRESQLIPLCDQVLSLINIPKLQRELTDYISHHKYPCSLFIAAWYLLRLGYIESLIFPADQIASSVFNILPASYKPFEDKGLAIISATKYAEARERVLYQFFEGREIKDV